MNNKTKIFLVFLIFLFIISVILRFITPSEPKVPTIEVTELTQNIDNSQTTFSNITFSGEDNFQQTKLPILAQQAKTDEKSLVTFVENKFGFKKDKSASNFWQNDLDQTMNYDRFAKTYFVRVSPITTTTNKLGQDELVSIAENYLSDLFQTNLTAIKKDIVFYDNGQEQPIQTNSQNADFIKIPLAVNVGGIPIMYAGSFEFPFFVTLDMSGNVSTFSFTPSIVTYKELGKKSLIGIDQAINNINLSKATIISVGVTQPININLNEVKGGNLTKADLEYRIDSKTGMIIPFYRFSGKVINSDDNELSVEILTPAVQQN